MYVHGVEIWPPPQPLNDEQKQTSCAESGIWSVAFVAMHIRSETPPRRRRTPSSSRSSTGRGCRRSLGALGPFGGRIKGIRDVVHPTRAARTDDLAAFLGARRRLICCRRGGPDRCAGARATRAQRPALAVHVVAMALIVLSCSRRSGPWMSARALGLSHVDGGGPRGQHEGSSWRARLAPV